ncbi:hypothetical protein [Microbacterium terricola]|uniref:Nitrate ABC transporter substrate-binding protein n=1 Tax=Microbacterium terricola TaxID=344163 RepID=A0ABM8DZ96_9MICO|nr:hypothetical protein [Microbacterium terricola]UYK41289.1 hypothetical protein OAU46_06565 [Microbacterium terricola]BDV30929.1 hypothetical protein Microterr_15890 [Microbacterium terricola]
MTRPLSRLGIALVLAATAALATTACSPASPTEAAPTESTVPSGNATSPAPSPTPTSSEAAPPADDATCETIIPAETVADFEELGWTSQVEPFILGGTELEGGIQCKWGELEAATDHIQMFGWAPVTPDQAIAAEEQLVADGWMREESPEGIYVTESADTAIYTDDEGYGWTYLFGDGWVKFADTKQSILLVEWPQA